MSQTIGELAVRIIANTNQFDTQIKNMGRVGQTATKSIAGLTRAIDTGLKVAIAGAAVAMGAFVASAAKVGASFEKETAILGSIRGISKATAEGAAELSRFSEKARELGASTAYSATEATIGMQQLARAGLSTNEVISAIGPALKFAGASASDMESATSLLASSFKQFGLDASNASRITDAFTIIQQQSLFDMQSLTEAMRYAGTVGASFGFSIEQTTAAVAMFRDLGLQGASAGVQFRMAMMRLSKPTAEAERTLKKYNISLDEVNPSLHSFDKIARRLAKANLDFPDIARIFSTRAAGSMSQIIEQFADGREKYSQFIEAIDEGGGATAATYDATLQNLSGFTDIAKSAFQELQLTIFETFSGPLMNVLGGEGGQGGLTGLLNEISTSIGYVADNMSSTIGNALGGITSAIDGNATMIAAKVAVFIENVVQLVATFLEWLPTILKVGQALLIVFGVAKLQAFIAATASVASMILGLVPAFGAASTAAQAFAASLALTNPVGWAVLLGTATAALIAFAFASDDSADRAAQYAREMREARKAVQEYRDAQRDAANEQVEASSKLFGAIRVELDARGDLTNRIENELRNVERLSEAQLQESIAKGEVFKATIAGEEAYINHATALLLNAQNSETYGHLIEQQTAAQAEATREYEAAVQKVDDLRETQLELERIQRLNTKGVIGLRNANLRAFGAVNGMTDITQHLKDGQWGLSASLNAVSTQMAGLVARGSMVSDTYYGMSAAIKDAQARVDEIIKRQAIADQRSKDKAADKPKGGGGGGRNRAKEMEQALQRMERQEQDLADKIEAINMSVTEKFAAQVDIRVRKAEQQAEKMLSIYKKGDSRRLKAEAALARKIVLIRQQALAETEKKFDDHTAELEDRLAKRTRNEVAELKRKLAEELQAEEDQSTLRQELLGEEFEAKMEALEKEEAMSEKFFRRNKTKLAEALKIIGEDREAAEKEFRKKQLEIIEEGEENKRRITEDANNQMRDLEEGFLKESGDIQKAAVKQSTLERLKEEQEAQRRIFAEKVKGHKKEAQLLKMFDSAQATERRAAEQAIIDDRIEIAGEYTNRVLQINEKLIGMGEGRRRTELEKEKSYLMERASLLKEMEKVRAETALLGAEQQAAAIEIVMQKIRELDRENRKINFKFLFNQAKALGGAFKSAGKGIAATFGAIASYFTGGQGVKELAQMAVKSFQDLGEKIMELDLGKLFQTIGSMALKSLGGLKTFFSGVMNGLSKIKDAASAAFGFLTGGAALGPMELLSGGAAAIQEGQAEGQAERDALQAQVDAGEISQEEADKAIAAGVGETDAAALGADFVQGVVDNAINMIQAIAAGAPAILNQLATNIPILIDSLVENIPILVATLIEQLPVIVFALIDGIIELLPVLVETLVTELPKLIDGVVILLTEKLPDLLEVLTPLVIDLVGLIVQEAPKIVAALVAALPDVVTFVVNAVKAILGAIPDIITTILEAVPTIITTLLGGVGDIIVALFDAIPIIINRVILALPDIITALIDGVLLALLKVAEALPTLIAALIEQIPVLIAALIESIAYIILALIEAIPDIIIALVKGLPDIITAIITLIPEIITVLVKKMPEIAIALVKAIFNLVFIELPKIAIELVKGIFLGIVQGVQALIDSLKELFVELVESIKKIFSAVKDGIKEGASKVGDTFKEIITFGQAETETYNDTPYAIRAGAEGMTANFAPRDYVIASKTKQGLLKQAVEAMSGAMSGTGGGMPDFIPATEGAGGGSINLAVNADGRLLDAITVNALEMGRAPKLEKRLTRASGARVGFDRGRYNNFS